jgi:hypothetical protein
MGEILPVGEIISEGTPFDVPDTRFRLFTIDMDGGDS